MKQTLFLLLVLFFLGCSGEEAPQDAASKAELLDMPWDSIVARASGGEVNMMMWQGDPQINAYMRDYVASQLRERYGITLRISPGQGTQIVQSLMAELQAGKDASELDLLWINGETFYQLRQIRGLWGPWTDHLANARYIDFDNPFIGIDFQQPVEGYECPWGNVQMALIYNGEQVPEPPQTRAELLAWAKANPGRFTFDTQFTGLTFLKALLIDIAGGMEALNGRFDEAKYDRYSAELWDYLRQLKPYLWREGTTFPEGVAPMHQMFANGELWFTMSNNDCEVDNKILQGVFPSSSRAYAPAFGTIQNTHYLGIPRLSPHKPAAMVVANFMISPEAQYRKQDPQVWGDGTVLDLDQLPAEWQTRFAELPNRQYAPPRVELAEHALMELAPDYMIRLAEDFRAEIIEQ
ncbi:MAG: ABC transporter substrate-binding protein [Lewinella sp.]|nr:ABC transporter substrate-binding protein [Lewinella sp.]